MLRDNLDLVTFLALNIKRTESWPKTFTIFFLMYFLSIELLSKLYKLSRDYNSIIKIIIKLYIYI